MEDLEGNMEKEDMKEKEELSPHFNVPSVIAQSCFTKKITTKNKITKEDEVTYNFEKIKERDVDYFYLLLLLCRQEMLYRNHNLLSRNEEDGKHTINEYYINEENEDVEIKPIEIDLSEFHEFDVVKAGKYGDLRPFLKKLEELYIRTNLFGKKKDVEKGENIKIIDSIKWCDEKETELDIIFTQEFVTIFLHTPDCFMNVDLRKLFDLSGKYTKSLYMLFKDYQENWKMVDGKKVITWKGMVNIRKTDIKEMIGIIPTKRELDGYKKQINDETDITFDYTETGRGRKQTYKFIIKSDVESAPPKTSKPTVSTPSGTTNPTGTTVSTGSISSVELKKVEKRIIKNYGEVHHELLDDAIINLEEEIPKAIKRNDPIRSNGGYLYTLYEQNLEENTPSEAEKKIDEWLEDQKNAFNYDYTLKEIHIIVINSVQFNDIVYVGSDYKLYSPIDKEIVTKTSEATWGKIDEIMESEGEDVVETQQCMNYRDDYSKSCFKIP